MEVYSTTSSTLIQNLDHDFYKTLPLNILFKFKNNGYPYLEGYDKAKIMIDSGAYFFNSRETNQTPEKTRQFIEEYKEYINNTKDDSRMVGYFDMDLRYMGLNGIKRIREELFELTDKIIPVYHSMWGVGEFKWMCRKYNYIGFPCSSNFDGEDFLPFIKYAHKHKCKIHGLGMDRDKVMRMAPFDSVDSAIWVRQGYMEYYANHEIEKNTNNNLKYQAIYMKRETITQLRRQMYYKQLWADYHKSTGLI